MATVLKDGFKRVTRYPWDKWTDGNSWLAKRGTDYDCADDSFIAALHKQAALRDTDVRTSKPKAGQVAFEFRAKAARKKK